MTVEAPETFEIINVHGTPDYPYNGHPLLQATLAWLQAHDPAPTDDDRPRPNVERLPMYISKFGATMTFSMANWRFDDPHCGTTCCMGGFIQELAFSGAMTTSIYDVAEAAGLTEDEAYTLFYPDDDNYYDPPINLNRVTPAIAADVLELFMKTGEIYFPPELAFYYDDEF